MPIPFNTPAIIGTEQQELDKLLIAQNKFCGNGTYSRGCADTLKQQTGSSYVQMTSSCTNALEMTALLADIQPGDQVIMPSYTFISTASAFAMRGADILWCDIRSDTKNIDETLIEELITEKTKAVVVVHYAGVACEMDKISSICRKYDLMLIEDSAQCIDCFYKETPLGSIGDLGTISFHETKNIHCGEGGALLVNNKKLINRAEILADKGTNRSAFLRGQVDKYTWVDLGSNFLMSEFQAAFLFAQLRSKAEITNKRRQIFKKYYDFFANYLPLEQLPHIPDYCTPAGHIFYIILPDLDTRIHVAESLQKKGIAAYFHYLPLHQSPYWHNKYSSLTLPVTEQVSDCLIRLPLYYSLTDKQVNFVCKTFKQIYPGK